MVTKSMFTINVHYRCLEPVNVFLDT